MAVRYEATDNKTVMGTNGPIELSKGEAVPAMDEGTLNLIVSHGWAEAVDEPLTERTVRELDGLLESIDDPEMIREALKEETRKSAKRLLQARLEAIESPEEDREDDDGE